MPEVNLKQLLIELQRLFPNELPRVTSAHPFDSLKINRAIGQQEVLRAIAAYIEQRGGTP